MDGIRKLELLRAACCIAGSDGDATEDERQILQKLVKDVGVGKASFEAMIERAESDKEYYAQHFQVLKADPAESLQTLLHVALADNRLTKDECLNLKRLANQLGVAEQQFDDWLQGVIKKLKAKDDNS